MPPELPALRTLSGDERVEALRFQLVAARSRTRTSLRDLESEVRTELVSVRSLPALLQSHQACLVGAALVAGFLYGNRR